ncbi:transporter [Saliphagus sp. LR7]|nr:transporter [Saliphagus sp. LR7]
MVRISTVVLLAGVVFLFLPEPITSLLGAAVILTGLVLRVLTDA